MATKCLFVVLSLWLVVGSGFFFASTLEEDYALRPGWLPLPFPQDNILNQHRTWHGRESSFPYKGLEFLEFHREFLAQSDDFRIYGLDTDGNANPDAAVIPVVALNGGLPQSLIVSAHVGDGTCPRPAMHRIDDGPHYIDGSPCDPASATCPCNADSATWTDRPPELRLHTPVFHNYSAILLGLNIQRFHTQGHGALGRHKPNQMITVPASPRDGAFYQWHKNIDNIYADWAVGRYQLITFEMPIFFSVASGAVGRPGSTLNVRSKGDVYRGTLPAAFDQYGARPRIGSDIYVGRNDGSNLLYAPGTKEWGTLNGWDIDALTILNPPPADYGWYFSVARGSVGLAGSAAANPGNAPNRGDLFETCADGANTNKLLRQQNELGLAGSNELDADELDALEYDRERRVQGTNDLADPGIYDRTRQWFSLRRDSTYGVRALGGTLVSPGDILRFDAGGNLVIDVAGAALGLGANDDLDALAIVDVNRSNTLDPGDLVYYSLDRISPALGAAGDSAADILCRTQAVAGGPWVACAGTPVRALALGLDSTTDDLDALDVRTGLCPLLASPSQPAPSQSSFPGACCRSNGTCSDSVLETGCVSPNRFLGEETVCSTALCPSAPGACCAYNGSCQFVSDYDCRVTWAGTFRGPGTTCPPNPVCPTPPGNDECVNASVIPYNFASPFQVPASDATNATEPPYFLPKDPPFSCYDHDVFTNEYGSGTIWYSYTVPPGPEPRRSIEISTQQAALHYPGPGAGDTRIGMYYAPNGDCSVLQEVACADNIPGDTSNLALYAPLRYDNPDPGKYYIMVGTAFNVDRGQTYIAAADPPPAQPPASIPTISTWGLVILTLVLIGWGYAFLPRRKREAG